MSEFDDPLVRNALEKLAGYLPDEDVAYATVRSRARTVRQRRAGVMTLVCVTAVGVGVFSASLRQSPRVSIADAVENSTTIGLVPSSTSAVSTTLPETTVPTVPQTAAPQLDDPVAGQQPQLEQVTTVVAPPADQAPTDTQPAPVGNTRPPRQAPPAVTAPATGNPPQNPAPTPASSNTPPAASRQSASNSSGGGSVTVSTDGTSVKIESATPNDGFSADVTRSAGSSVRVTFTGQNVTYRVKATLDGGRIVFEVQKEDRPEPTNTEFADNGGTQGGSGDGSIDGSGDHRSGSRSDSSGSSSTVG